MSNVIRTMLNIECAVLMGANIASEVAKEDFCEATIGKFEMFSVWPMQGRVREFVNI